MKKPNPSISACAVVIGSCLAWISGISLVLVYFLDLSLAAGWVIAGSLGMSSMIALAIIFHEMWHSPDLTDFMEVEEACGSNPWEIPYVRGRSLSAASSSAT